MYFRARYYDPQTGEFVSRDPLEYVDGMSQYRGYFVPSKVDPLGLSCCGGNSASEILIAGVIAKRKNVLWKEVFKTAGGKETEEDAYGHWWTEVDSSSYGWWPVDGVGGIIDTVKGVPGELNGTTSFGGTETRDPHHGDAGENVKELNVCLKKPFPYPVLRPKPGIEWRIPGTLKYGTGKGTKCCELENDGALKPGALALVKSCLNSAPGEFDKTHDTWRYPGRHNCHSFQKWLLRQCCVRTCGEKKKAEGK
jgi:hypothetical protein